MESTFAKISDIIDGKIKSPIPIEIFPNNMGINLCSVDAISWQRQEDGQITNLTAYFIPEIKRKEK